MELENNPQEENMSSMEQLFALAETVSHASNTKQKRTKHELAQLMLNQYIREKRAAGWSERRIKREIKRKLL
jgi:hypothetical protein